MARTGGESQERSAEIERVATEIANRLRARGIAVSASDSPDDLESLREAVERFEQAVEDGGGDLMVDEPPARQSGQPDDPHFLLPKRNAGESVPKYVQRLSAATSALRGHRPHS